MMYKGKDSYENLIIPDEVGGKKVTALAPGLFKNSKLVNVTLPASVTVIPDECVSGSPRLSADAFLCACKRKPSCSLVKISSVTAARSNQQPVFREHLRDHPPCRNNSMHQMSALMHERNTLPHALGEKQLCSSIYP